MYCAKLITLRLTFLYVCIIYSFLYFLCQTYNIAPDVPLCIISSMYCAKLITLRQTFLCVLFHLFICQTYLPEMKFPRKLTQFCRMPENRKFHRCSILMFWRIFFAENDMLKLVFNIPVNLHF